MENRLNNLYSLQIIDSQLQEVHDLKGDLPAIVEELEENVNKLKLKIKELNTTIKQLKISRDNADLEIIDLAEKIKKYKSQQLNVKSNKQYDALTKEIDAADKKSEKLEIELEIAEGRMEIAKKDVEIFAKEFETEGEELDERRKELREVSKEHEKEELKLKHEREKMVVRIDKADLEKYERIRKAKGGVAVVPIKRNACGGCFSRVPPQKTLEIRQNSRFYTCEHCGRILVSDHIVSLSKKQ
ncbi:MAG: C4-type zinc ribbon domain-containing protein [Bacteroidota bacterium]|nr:C4-type zinc ribbon domain-containing protein [Bacteroidota bacterium]